MRKRSVHRIKDETVFHFSISILWHGETPCLLSCFAIRAVGIRYKCGKIQAYFSCKYLGQNGMIDV